MHTRKGESRIIAVYFVDKVGMTCHNEVSYVENISPKKGI